MILDAITLKDLHLLGNPGQDVFSLVDRCVTQKGRERMRQHFRVPPKRFSALQEVQESIRYLSQTYPDFPAPITNGTLVMIEQFFQSGDWLSRGKPSWELRLSHVFRKWFFPKKENPVYFYLSHFRDLVLGAEKLMELENHSPVPGLIAGILDRIKKTLDDDLFRAVRDLDPDSGLSQTSKLSYQLRRSGRNRCDALVTLIAEMDAWISMGRATKELGWVFPTLVDRAGGLHVEGLYHPLIPDPVAYDFPQMGDRRFLFLTGANMSGKTTLMRSLGLAVFLAHIGMGVPARSMRTDFLDFVTTNMAVEDDLLKGESYFFAEVQRIKGMARYLNQEKRGLILLDEMFKGTNVHDAQACTAAIVKALLGHPDHWIILSTHLFEVARELENDPRIQFAFMVTQIYPDGDYRFLYELKEGISQDQIGYQILVREGVLDRLTRRA